MKDEPKRLSWRERLIQSFGKDPLICRNCNEEMLLWRIWHPGHGYIYDLSRDGPLFEYKKSQDKKEKNDTALDNSRKRPIQLCLFPV